MVMTHWMRTMHDAILVGIGTALNDDPQLNVRHLPQPIPTPYNLSRPVIIDPYLRLPTSCKLLQNFQNGTGRRPWIICATFNSQLETTDNSVDNRDQRTQKTTLTERKKALEEAGARIIEIPLSSGRDGLIPSSHLSLPAILKSLGDLGIQSLMVEGGAYVIGSFFEAPENIDTLIITVAPVFLGSDGVGYQCKYPVLELSDSKRQARFKEVHTELIGRDTVIALVSNKG
ncbi:hypothetical protein BYT27DRAFT_7190263 [Phlegmacium glaucopus]|nr:hypothetical protein BYT27DRAFT_7190263 [Phlegmacium glaucopus]